MAESYMHLISFTIQKRTRYDQPVYCRCGFDEDNWGETRSAVAREISCASSVLCLECVSAYAREYHAPIAIIKT